MRLFPAARRAVLGAALSCGAALLSACGDDPPSAPPPQPPPAAEPADQTAAKPRLYDAEGQLLESKQAVVGVAIPMGFKPDPVVRRRHRVYRAKGIPLDKVIAYFGPRLFTGTVERVGAGVVYKRAVPMRHRDSLVPVDVAISAVGTTEVKVTIDEYGAVPLKPPPVDDLQKTLLREQKQIE